tara:strand:- start:538 stop:1593 length:1056 start_codon:yes stop_codon:yes gene_type:complete
MDWLKKLKIGYVPMSRDLKHPGDRRRFLYYAKQRNINFEIASIDTQYDAVVLTQAADHTQWINCASNKSRYIFDFIDSYLAVDPLEFKGFARGTAKYLSGKHKYFRPNFWKTMKDMCACSEAVICVTDEQAKSIKPFCEHVYQILDIQEEVVTDIKNDYSVGKTFNLVWEGFPGNLYPFNEISDVLSELDQKYPIALHFVTDVQFYQYVNSYGLKNTIDLIKKIFHRSFIYQWNVDMFPRIALASDAAIIPLDINYPLFKGKPESKLVLFWKLGLPTITSASPAYSRAMKNAGLDLACLNAKDWVDRLEKLITNERYREHSGVTGRVFAEQEYNANKVLDEWDKIFINHFS